MLSKQNCQLWCKMQLLYFRMLGLQLQNILTTAGAPHLGMDMVKELFGKLFPGSLNVTLYPQYCTLSLSFFLRILFRSDFCSFLLLLLVSSCHSRNSSLSNKWSGNLYDCIDKQGLLGGRYLVEPANGCIVPG